MPFALLFGILLERCGSLAQLGEQLPYKQWVTGSSPVAPTTKNSADEYLCGNGSVVERHLAKVNVAGSNLVSRSTNSTALFFYFHQFNRTIFLFAAQQQPDGLSAPQNTTSLLCEFAAL